MLRYVPRTFIADWRVYWASGERVITFGETASGKETVEKNKGNSLIKVRKQTIRTKLNNTALRTSCIESTPLVSMR